MDLRHAADVCLCDNCRRHLYLPEEMPANADTAPNKRAAKKVRQELALGPIL